MSSLPANIKRIGSKATEKRRRHHFLHYKSIGTFCCHGHQSFDPVCLKALSSLSPTPVMPHIKFDQDWPTGLRDIKVRTCKIFVIQGQVTPKSNPIRPKIKLVGAFMAVLVTSNFEDDSIKNERVRAWRQHFPIISLWEFFRHSRAANSVVSGPIWPKFELVRDLCMFSLPANIKRIG